MQRAHELIAVLTGKPCFPLAFGTAQIVPPYSSAAAETAAFKIFDAALDAGCNVFDTALLYGLGQSEKVLGKWLRKSGVREQVIIATKGCHPTLLAKPRITRADLRADFNVSCANLQTDYIDICFLHHDNRKITPAEIVDVCEDVIPAGSVRALGVSNWSHDRIEAANLYARQKGVKGFDVSSPQFSLAPWRGPHFPGCLSISGRDGAAARAWYSANNIPVMAWASLSHGLFSGVYPPRSLNRRLFSTDTLLCMASYGTAGNFRRLSRAEALAKDKGATVPQIALAYILNQNFPVMPIVGMRSPRSLASSVSAIGIKLTPEGMRWLESGDAADG